MARNQHSGLTPIERFEEKVLRCPMSGCWIWTGSTHPKGYGYFGFEGRVVKAHRWSYEHHVGPIPDGLEIDHLCRVRACVRPDHLEAVPHRINVLRGDAQAARQARQTHCIHGHALSGENLYLNPDGRRQCMQCRRAIDAKRRPPKTKGIVCKHGHVFDEANTYIRPNGARTCRACLRMRYHQKRANHNG